jgi:hypothetical protein
MILQHEPLSQKNMRSPFSRNRSGKKFSGVVGILLIFVFMIVFLSILMIAELSALGVSLISSNGTSGTFQSSIAADNGRSVATLSSADFQLYLNGSPFSSGATTNFFPQAGVNSTITTKITIQYSRLLDLLWTNIVYGAKNNESLIGSTTFDTPLGSIELPLGFANNANNSSVSGSNASSFIVQTSIQNDPNLAYITSATFSVYGNGIKILNGSSFNNFPGAGSGSNTSILTSIIAFSQNNALNLLISYILHGGMVRLSVIGGIKLRAIVNGGPSNSISLPLDLTTIPSNPGLFLIVPIFLLFLIAILGFVSFWKGYASFS